MRRHLSVPLTALTLLALTACGSTTASESGDGKDSRPGGGSSAAPSVDPSAAALTGVRWTVDSLTADGKKRAAPAGSKTHLELTGKGRLQGSLGCNQFGAEAVLRGDTLTLRQEGMTQMACSTEIQAFENALSEVLKGRLKAVRDGDRLTLTAPNGTTVALTTEEPAPLAGTVWTVTDLLTGDLSEPVPGGTEGRAKLTFAKDGKGGTISGSLGCNTFRGSATATGDKITLGRISTTRKLCTGTAGQVEAHLLTVLDGTVRYTLQHRNLTLTGPSGAGAHALAER
ncbi:META domain-containing protein [Streptomyces yaizuensis]|uniref:META domain-containing protein n=1 Tax=Streptomyces yaizuensis TaxID=2989713 RepID=A0ABQ5P1R2_9ACTN|nr:META domain-containing protein [Streptomyces sp. YSPA8]GLF96539.1 META domain-containing protein [Streptomyces sp. YSPA8]